MTEFKVGDPVTFFPYERQLKAVVKKVYQGCPYTFNQENDDRIFYELTGRSYEVNDPHNPGSKKTKHDPVNTFCTGKSIKESKLFEQWDGEF